MKQAKALTREQKIAITKILGNRPTGLNLLEEKDDCWILYDNKTGAIVTVGKKAVK